jgi:type I restriction enzyme M protein
MTNTSIINKMWDFAGILRDDGVSYGDYVEQLTYLLFLKMADEQSTITKRPSIIPKKYDWQSLVKLSGTDIEEQYRLILTELAKEEGLLGLIFRKSQNRIQDPAKLKRLVTLIDGETWMSLDVDVKGEIYEGLLERNAQDTKSGAGQYFTPRSLIRAMVEVMHPEPGQTVCDPACGTGGFFLATNEYLNEHHKLDVDQQLFLRNSTFKGWDIVDNTARLCAMNLFLHGIGGENSPVTVGDSLISDPGERYDLILTNPPFGRKSSIKITNTAGEIETEQQTYEREDFWATTSNKQLNFLQHIKTLLKIGGRAAVVVPDNVLFEAGAGETIRMKLLHDYDVHTILRLPTGIFYANGVKANVIFFDKKPASENSWTKEVWFYDLRTNQHFTLKQNMMTLKDLQDFIACYNPSNRHERSETDRFKKFTYDELIKRDNTSLDIFWLKDESLEDLENLPEPEILLAEITENLRNALEQFEELEASLRK